LAPVKAYINREKKKRATARGNINIKDMRETKPTPRNICSRSVPVVE
jgi:hypothetical protein